MDKMLQAVIDTLQYIVDQNNLRETDSNYIGCHGCKFYSKELWEVPCCRCKRNMSDFYRKEEKKDAGI